MAGKSTAVVKAKPAKGNLPANINAEMEAEVAALASRLSAPSGDRIALTQAKTFKLPDGRESPGPLDAIIVDFISYNAYYEGRYDPNNIVPPNCFAMGLEPTGLIPSKTSPDVQAEACASCWANQFGTAGKGKACQNRKLLALLPADATEDTPLMILSVSPTAIKGFDGYVGSVARAFQKPVRAVITEIGIDENSDYAKLTFGNPQACSNTQLALAHSRREEAMQRLMTEPDFSSLNQQTSSKPKALTRKPAAKPAAKRK